jgi:hypothetical protein
MQLEVIIAEQSASLLLTGLHLHAKHLLCLDLNLLFKEFSMSYSAALYGTLRRTHSRHIPIQ